MGSIWTQKKLLLRRAIVNRNVYLAAVRTTRVARAPYRTEAFDPYSVNTQKRHATASHAARHATSPKAPQKPRVIDGDTIVVAGQFVRLHGIDAPELDQTFWWRGQQLLGGTMALAALEALTAGVEVRCEVVDRHGRLVAKVFSPNGVDIGRRLVSAGWALAYRRYSTDYVDAEDEARKARRGMWRGTFVKPWVWRPSSPPRGTQAPSRTAAMSARGR